ncbi:hypothetical protein RNJ44_00915 [Nakaseomyces bracarensis]|uniref:Response regulatory domain-containing protein n=1 Tax=Nakaseomyces bracarensis TaxID=273131 RepID=A0ABR4NQM1_9SACH
MSETHSSRPFSLISQSSSSLANFQSNWKASQSWKVWLQLDYNTDDINQPVSVEFDENDTVEDLKKKLMEKLGNMRWNRHNDLISIGIGIYTQSPSLQDSDLINASSPIEKYPPPSPTLGKSQIAQPNPQQGMKFPERPSLRSKYMSSHRRSNSASPTFQSIPTSRMASKLNNNGLEIHNEQLTNLYSHPKYASPNPHVTKFSPKRALRYSVEDVDDMNYRLVFEPDEQVYQIYCSLFGSIGTQTSSTPLLVFSNLDLGHAPQGHPPVNVEVDPGLPTTTPLAFSNSQELDVSNHPDELTNYGEVVPGATEFIDNNNSYHQDIESDYYQDELRNEIPSNENMQGIQPALLLVPKDFQKEGNSEEKFSRESSYDHKELSFNADGNTTIQNPDNEENTDGPKKLTVDTESISVNNEYEQSRTRNNSQLLLSPLDVLKTIEPSPNPLPKSKSPNVTALDTLPFKLTTTSEKVFPKINVLIVEDNVINQAILGSFLRKNKISYKIAKNGKEAVDKWKEGNLHLIFMDLQLPVLSGIEAAKKIRELEKEKGIANQSERVSTPGSINSIHFSDSANSPVIIVALTASNSQEDKREALISGCNDYLTKPVNLLWLSKKITEWGCMQALIDFDGWKKEESRMTDSVLVRSPHRNRITSATKSNSSLSRSNSSGARKMEKSKSSNG